MSDIKARIETLQAEIRKRVTAIEALQEQCPHSEFTRGLTMIACIQEVDICTTCGWAKPIVYDPLGGGEDYTSAEPKD